MVGLSCGEDPRREDRSSTATRHIETETNRNKRKSPGQLRVLEKDNSGGGGDEDKTEFNITMVFPTSAPVTMFDASAVKEQLFINNFISRSSVSTCQLNLYAADADSDGSLDRDEYAEFVRLESQGRVDESFGDLRALYVALYFAVACNQCYDETQDDNCCLGDKGVIVLPQPGDGHDVGQWVLFLCSTVDEAIDDEFGGLPTTSPTAPPAGEEPTPTPAAGRPTAPETPPTRAPNRRRPTGSPTPEPTRRTRAPGARPSDNPTDKPTPEPSRTPRANPTRRPLAPPTPRPTRTSAAPTTAPGSSTTDSPSREPTNAPASVAPTRAPVARDPTGGPTPPSPVATATTAPTRAPTVRTSAPVSFAANDTLCVQFFYSLKNTAGLSADDIMQEVNNTLKTGLELATRNITIEILNASFPSGSAAAAAGSSRSLLLGSGRCGDAGLPPPEASSSGGRCRGLADSPSAVRGQRVIYGGLAHEFGDESADRIMDALLTALHGPKDFGPTTLSLDCRHQRRRACQRRNQGLSKPHTRRQKQQPSRRLVYYTDVLPPNVTDVVDDSFCAGLGGGGSGNNSTSGVKCAFVSTEVCVVLEEGDDADAIETAIDDGFRIAILDGSFFDAIPPENVP